MHLYCFFSKSVGHSGKAHPDALLLHGDLLRLVSDGLLQLLHGLTRLLLLIYFCIRLGVHSLIRRRRDSPVLVPVACLTLRHLCLICLQMCFLLHPHLTLRSRRNRLS